MSGLGWAVLGTAGIARSAFLPALGEAGGTPLVVGSRSGASARSFADANGIADAVEGYAAAIDHPGVEAVYVALPNSLHAEWSAVALRAGRAVLCEKPLCTSVTETAALLDVARATGSLLWEAFVFPFHEQWARVGELLGDGAIGDLREVSAAFHFPLGMGRDDIRMQRELGGGSLADVGCYPVHLAHLLLGGAPARTLATAVMAPDVGVDVEVSAILEYADERRLAMTCGFRRAIDTTARLLGAEGTIEVTNPYHPRGRDTLTLRRPGADPLVEAAAADRHSFTAALRHITAAVRGEDAPRHLATDDSLGTAQALASIAAAWS